MVFSPLTQLGASFNALMLPAESLNSDEAHLNPLAGVLDKYRDFYDIFSEEEANVLPEYTPYDHPIDTREKPIPYGPIYNMSRDELVALRKYLDDSLRKG